MRDRPAVFVRLEDKNQAFGWGEIFANWPVAGAEHRANLLVQDIAELVLGARLENPSDLFYLLENKTHIRALQCGERGPFRQVIAGLDIAAWDLFARRAGQSVRKLLSNGASSRVAVYASGIHIKKAYDKITEARSAGFTAFKVKVGFDLQDDARRLNELVKTLKSGEKLFVDANQAWSHDQASAFIDQVESSDIGWVEEPIPVDAPDHDWKRVAANSPIRLAGGENIAGRDAFTAAIELGALSILQPDITKWGGFTGCLAVAREAKASGCLYCPHFLGGGIGLIASAHLLAATGTDGFLEVDVNPNPLRDLLAPISGSMRDAYWHVQDAPGLGIDILPYELEAIKTMEASRSQ